MMGERPRRDDISCFRSCPKVSKRSPTVQKQCKKLQLKRQSMLRIGRLVPLFDETVLDLSFPTGHRLYALADRAALPRPGLERDSSDEHASLDVLRSEHEGRRRRGRSSDGTVSVFHQSRTDGIHHRERRRGREGTDKLGRARPSQRSWQLSPRSLSEGALTLDTFSSPT